MVNGVAFEVGADELPGLDARERNYERREVAGQLDVTSAGASGPTSAGAPAVPAPGAGAASGAWPSRAATTSACWPASTLLRQRRRFELLTEPPVAPVADLSLVRNAPVAVPRSVR